MAIANKKFKTYSLGNKQRLGMALALLGNPDLLILDEPTNGFDPMGIVEFRQLLLELNQKQDMTILISSHMLSELENIITRVGFIDKGCLIEELQMEDLHEKCQTYIELKVDHAEKAVATLEETLALTEFEVLPNQVIHVFGNKELIPRISRVLNDNEIALYSINEKNVTLEDYFIQLIGGNQFD